jgi:hypothetical protein
MDGPVRFGSSVMELLGEDAPAAPELTPEQRLLIGLRLVQAGVTEIGNGLEALIQSQSMETWQ